MKMNPAILVLALFISIQIGCSTPSKNTKADSASTTPNQTTPVAKPSPAPSAGVQAPAKSDSKASGDILVCKRSGEERSLEVESVQPKGCKLWYSKLGNRSDVASSSVGPTHCESVRARIAETLSGAGFQCQK